MSNWGDPIWPPAVYDEADDTFWTNLAAIGVVVVTLAIIVAVGVIAGNAR